MNTSHRATPWLIIAGGLIAITLLYILLTTAANKTPEPEKIDLTNQMLREYSTRLTSMQTEYDKLLAATYIIGYMDRSKDSRYRLLERLNISKQLRTIVLDSTFRMLTPLEKEKLRNMKPPN